MYQCGVLRRETQLGLVSEGKITTKGTFHFVFDQREKEREREAEIRRRLVSLIISLETPMKLSPLPWPHQCASSDRLPNGYCLLLSNHDP